MLRSMYSGISGLKNFQTKLDVIGNNIANVNTHGFKKSRVIFKDAISQTISGASGPLGGTTGGTGGAASTRGGVNPKQVGLGSQIATIDTIHSGGSSQSTGNTLDLAIEGDGYFEVGTSADKGEKYYTRAGNFYPDKEGNIVTSDGLYLKDKDGKQIKLKLEAETTSIGENGEITQVINGKLEKVATIRLVKFNNPGGLEKVGGNYYLPSANSGDPVETTPQVEGAGKVQSGYLEMSNVDLSEEFTEMIVAQRGLQANTRIITTSDEILQELVNLKR